jgi:integrase
MTVIRHAIRLGSKGRYKVEERTRLVKNDDLPRFYTAAVSLENPIVRDYVLLLLFTGLRRREASSLRWKEHIDLQGRVIHIAAADTKPGVPATLAGQASCHNPKHQPPHAA